MMLNLSPAERRELRARAHPLHPVVLIGQQGLTDAVTHEIDIALKAHELIKVRVFNDDRDARETMLATICEKLGCAPVQHLGKLLVLWRPKPEEESKPRRRVAAKPEGHAEKTGKPRKSARHTAKKTGKLIDHRGHLVGAPLSARRARRLSGDE